MVTPKEFAVQLSAIFPATQSGDLQRAAGPLLSAMEKGSINTLFRQSAFIAQLGHESWGFRLSRENLNYSRERLLDVFPKYFNEDNVDEYAHQPLKIASRVYANRIGNGPEESGDGFRYYGRGWIQLTGKANYTAYCRARGMMLDDETLLWLEGPEGASDSAEWFWTSKKLNTYADKEDIVKMTKLINGGTNGLAKRQELYDKAKEVFGA